jgi:hypothetical protein
MRIAFKDRGRHLSRVRLRLVSARNQCLAGQLHDGSGSLGGVRRRGDCNRRFAFAGSEEAIAQGLE